MPSRSGLGRRCVDGTGEFDDPLDRVDAEPEMSPGRQHVQQIEVAVAVVLCAGDRPEHGQLGHVVALADLDEARQIDATRQLDPCSSMATVLLPPPVRLRRRAELPPTMPQRRVLSPICSR